MKHEIAQEVAKATPPVAVTSAHAFLGMALSDWVLAVTLVYTVLLGAHLIWKWVKEIKGRK